MNCITDGAFRHELDGEASQAESLAIGQHLSECADCSRRAQRIATQRELVQSRLSMLAPQTDEAASETPFALARFKARYNTRAEAQPSLLHRWFGRRRISAWGVPAILILIVGSLSFVVPGAWADKLFALFRVSRITVVPVDSNRIRNAEGGLLGRQISQLLADDIAYISEPGKPQDVATAERASQLAGLTVRLPGLRTDAPKLSVEGENAFQMTLNRARLQSILDESGYTDVQLPADLDGARITVDIPQAVQAIYGNCPKIGPHLAARTPADWRDCVALAQIRTPSVIAPADLNIAQLAKIGLQLTGMTAEEAQAFSQNVDWTSTLVIPIPREAASFQKVRVDGVTGTLISQKAVEDRPEGYTLLWLKNGIIYSLTGFGDATQAVRLADSLR